VVLRASSCTIEPIAPCASLLPPSAIAKLRVVELVATVPLPARLGFPNLGQPVQSSGRSACWQLRS
jgi:hypothetical protein